MDAEFKITQKQDCYFLSGYLSERADLSILAKGKVENSQPIKLNFRDLQKSNSLGINLLVKTVLSWGGLEYELHEVNHELATQMEMIPDLLQDSGKVVSLSIEFDCVECGKSQVKVLAAEEVKKKLASAPDLNQVCPCPKKAMMAIGDEDLDFCFL